MPTSMGVVDPKLAKGVGGELNKVGHCTTHLNLSKKINEKQVVVL